MGRRTVILTGHYDVVDTEEYGEFRKYAYDVEAWKNASGPELEGLLEMLTPEARADFCSGEWLFGRGVNDMKGGLAVGLAVTGWFGGRVLEGRGPGGKCSVSVRAGRGSVLRGHAWRSAAVCGPGAAI